MASVNSDVVCKDDWDNAHHANVDWLNNKDHRNWISYHKLQNLRDNLDMKIGILEIEKVIGITESQNKLDNYKKLFERTKETLKHFSIDGKNRRYNCYNNRNNAHHSIVDW